MKRTGRAEASPLCAVPQKASAAATDLRTLLVSRSSSIGCYTALGAHAVVLAVAVDGAMAALIGAALVPARAGGGPLFVHRTGNGLGTPNRNLPALAPPGFVALLEHANGHPSTIARRIRRTFVPYVCDNLFRQRTFLRES